MYGSKESSPSDCSPKSCESCGPRLFLGGSLCPPSWNFLKYPSSAGRNKDERRECCSVQIGLMAKLLFVEYKFGRFVVVESDEVGYGSMAGSR